MWFLVAGVTATSADSSPFPVKTASVLGLVSLVGCWGADLPVHQQPWRQRSSEFHPDLRIRCIFKSLLSCSLTYISLRKNLIISKDTETCFFSHAQRASVAVAFPGQKGRGAAGWSGVHPRASSISFISFIAFISLAARTASSTRSTRWQCLPALHTASAALQPCSTLSISSEEFLLNKDCIFPQKRMNGEDCFYRLFKNIGAVQKAGVNFRA